MASVKTKIIVSIFALVAIVAGLSGALLDRYYATIVETGKVSQLTTLTPPVSALIHELQKERGRSAGYIGSGRADALSAKLEAQRRETDAKAGPALERLAAFDTSTFAPELAETIASAQSALGDLAAQRSAISNGERTVGEMAKWYIGTIASLLDVIKSMSADASSGEMRSALVAYVALMEVKERAGLERAMGNAGFAKGAFSPNVYDRFTQLLGEQEAFLRVFREKATAQQVAFYDATLRGESVEAVKRMRAVAKQAPFSGSTDGVTTADWFPAITAKINLMKTVEDRLTRDLSALAARANGDAWSSLTLIASAVLAVIVGAIATGVALAIGVSRPLARLTEAATEIEMGGVSQTVPGVARRDEIGALARSVKAINERSLEAMRIRLALESSSAMMMLADEAYNIVYLNAPLKALLERLEPEIQKSVPAFRVDRLIGSSVDVFHANPSGNRATIAGLTGAHKGRLALGDVSLDLAVNPVINASGQRLGTVVEWRDVTRELEATDEIDAVVAAATEGDFSRRARLTDAPPALKAVGERLNQVAATVETGLGEIRRVMQAMHQGDLTEQVTGDFQGVFREVQDSVNGSMDRLGELVADIADTTDTVRRNADQIAGGAADLAARAEQQASSLEETAATMEEMSASIKSNADSSTSASALAADASRRADEGGAVVASAVGAMREIEGSAAKISEIISVIDGIAFQTNLLALNAAVEAARAGDAGKGFAVVASEVRSLAQRSSEASNDIRGLISTSSSQVSEGVKLVTQTGESLEGIVGSIARVEESITCIASASAEQSSGVQEISSAINHMDEMTQHNSSMADESASSARLLSNGAQQLGDLIAFFKTNHRASGESVQDQAWAALGETAAAAPRAEPVRAPAQAASAAAAPTGAAAEEWSDF